MKKCIIVKSIDEGIKWFNERDVWYDDIISVEKCECEPEWMNAEDILFLLYTSGSTGKPKGIVHTTGGYAVYASLTHHYIFDYKDGDIYWCTGDIGWVNIYI